MNDSWTPLLIIFVTIILLGILGRPLVRNPRNRCYSRTKDCHRRRLGAVANLGRPAWVRPECAATYRAR